MWWSGWGRTGCAIQRLAEFPERGLLLSKTESLFPKSDPLCLRSDSLCRPSESLGAQSDLLCLRSESLLPSGDSLRPPPDLLCERTESLSSPSDSACPKSDSLCGQTDSLFAQSDPLCFRSDSLFRQSGPLFGQPESLCLRSHLKLRTSQSEQTESHWDKLPSGNRLRALRSSNPKLPCRMDELGRQEGRRKTVSASLSCLPAFQICPSPGGFDKASRNPCPWKRRLASTPPALPYNSRPQAGIRD